MPDFLYSTRLVYKILPTNPVACKLAFNTLYTSHLRYTVLCGAAFFFFPHTDLGQKAVFHSFARKIALIQNSGRSKHALPLHNKYRIDQVHEENSIISRTVQWEQSAPMWYARQWWAFSEKNIPKLPTFDKCRRIWTELHLFQVWGSFPK